MYSLNEEEHVKHLKLVLRVLRDNQLFAKRSKCQFEIFEIEYLGHIVMEEGVQANPKKIEVTVSWPMPTTIKGLCRFLGLKGCYRKFIKGYGAMAFPLRDMFGKDGFVWTQATETAFNQFKEIISHPQALALPDFTKRFILKCDASGLRFGTILMQESKLIAFLSKALKG